MNDQPKSERQKNLLNKTAAVNQIRDAGLPALAQYVQSAYANGASIDDVATWLRAAADICLNPSVKQAQPMIPNEPPVS